MDRKSGSVNIFIILLTAGVIALSILIFLSVSDSRSDKTNLNPESEDMSAEVGNGGDLISKEPIIPVSQGEGDYEEKAPIYSGTILAGKNSPLLDFNKSDYEAAIATNNLIVLYFYANWCPICRAEFPLMQAAFDKIQDAGVIGFRVNYNDNETDSDEIGLAREFGVAYQHTKVLIRNRNRLLKSLESWSEARYLEEINNIISN